MNDSHPVSVSRITSPLTPAQIRAARALLNWTQSELAARAQVARKTVADYEGGRRKLQRRTLDDLGRALEDGGVIFQHDGVSFGRPPLHARSIDPHA
jgi:transcriptional regulator with XRE-family HTH domain